MQPQTTIEIVLTIIGGLCGTFLGFRMMVGLVNLRSKPILDKWAAENGVEILLCKLKHWPFTGPFKWWTSGRGQVVYFLRVRRRDSSERSCWVRCGTPFWGIWFSNMTEVKWDESAAS
jgi:hypothetical protein